MLYIYHQWVPFLTFLLCALYIFFIHFYWYKTNPRRMLSNLLPPKDRNKAKKNGKFIYCICQILTNYIYGYMKEKLNSFDFCLLFLLFFSFFCCLLFKPNIILFKLCFIPCFVVFVTFLHILRYVGYIVGDIENTQLSLELFEYNKWNKTKMKQNKITQTKKMKKENSLI